MLFPSLAAAATVGGSKWRTHLISHDVGPDGKRARGTHTTLTHNPRTGSNGYRSIALVASAHIAMPPALVLIKKYMRAIVRRRMNLRS